MMETKLKTKKKQTIALVLYGIIVTAILIFFIAQGPEIVKVDTTHWEKEIDSLNRVIKLKQVEFDQLEDDKQIIIEMQETHEKKSDSLLAVIRSLPANTPCEHELKLVKLERNQIASAYAKCKESQSVTRVQIKACTEIINSQNVKHISSAEMNAALVRSAERRAEEAGKKGFLKGLGIGSGGTAVIVLILLLL
jgi:hypothetical protein